MRSASGDQRIAAMTEVLAELVRQRQEALDRVQAIDASRFARLMQQTAGGSVACQVLTLLPFEGTGRQ